MGLHARLVDAEDFSPLQGTVHVHTPQNHRPVHVTDPSGEFHMLLAPDILYCLSVHAVHPYRSSQQYHAIHVAVLRLGAQWVIQGTGPKGLTDRHLFLAERVYADDAVPGFEPQLQQQQQGHVDHEIGSSSSSSNSSSSSGAGSAARRLGRWQARQRHRQQVLLRDATEGLCTAVFTSQPRAKVV
jgi:hypothetical protein